MDLGNTTAALKVARFNVSSSHPSRKPSSSHHFSIPSTHSQPLTENPISRNCPVREGITFAEVVWSSSPKENHPSHQTNPTGHSTSLKHHCSPDNGEVCKRCLRPGHKVDDYRHQLTCRRCSSVGHFGIRCPLRTPPYPSFDSKEKMRSKKQSPLKVAALKPLLHVPAFSSRSSPSTIRVSLPIFETIYNPKRI